MIELTNVKKTYSDKTVLYIEKLSVEQGESLALTGPNGSGKSTLLKILSKNISCDGKITGNENILYVPQSSLVFDMSVLSNVTFSMSDKSKKEKEEKAIEALKQVGLSSFYKKNAMNLSGGEKARLAIARILVKDCDILLLDEPTAAVDIDGTEIIENAILNYIKEKNATLIFATHSPSQAKRLGKKIILLQNGEIAEYSTPEELFENPSTEFGKKFVKMWRY